jgi:hypothetical protein
MLDSITVQRDSILRIGQELQRPGKVEESVMMESIVVASPPDSQEGAEEVESEGSEFSEETEDDPEDGETEFDDEDLDDDGMILEDDS